MSANRPRSAARIFLIPSLIALLTMGGLVVALLGDGWRDHVAWVTLAIPVATALFFSLRHGRKAP